MAGSSWSFVDTWCVAPDNTGEPLSQRSPFLCQAVVLREVGPVTQGHPTLEVDSEAICLVPKPRRTSRASLQGHIPGLIK